MNEHNKMTWMPAFSQNPLLILSKLCFLFNCILLTNAASICTSKIRGTRLAKCDKFPYVVFIGETGTITSTCAGSIVHKEWVLTTGRCVVGHVRTELYVISGSNVLTSEDSAHNVVTIISHPDFNPDNYTDDLAMMQVYPPFIFDNRVKPIAIGDPLQREKAVTVRWGQVENVMKSEALRSLTVEIISAEECHSETEQSCDKLPGQVCVAGEEMPCEGDWGAPLVLRGQMVGMFSYRVDKCLQRGPAVFTNVEYYKSWIEEVLMECECGTII